MGVRGIEDKGKKRTTVMTRCHPLRLHGHSPSPCTHLMFHSRSFPFFPLAKKKENCNDLSYALSLSLSTRMNMNITFKKKEAKSVFRIDVI